MFFKTLSIFTLFGLERRVAPFYPIQTIYIPWLTFAFLCFYFIFRFPVSKADSCTSDSRLMLKFQACPDVLNTESTGKLNLRHSDRLLDIVLSPRATTRSIMTCPCPFTDVFWNPYPIRRYTRYNIIYYILCIIYIINAYTLFVQRRFKSMLTGRVTDLLKQTVS